MIRSIGRRLTLMLFCTAALSLSGCLSTGRVSYPYEDGKVLKKEELPSPEDHTLIFGNIGTDYYASGGIFSTLEFAQIDPQFEARRIYPGTNGSLFYLSPIKPGRTYKLIYWSIKSGRTTLYSIPGIQKGKPDMTFTARKPGLQYTGSYFFGDTIEEKKFFGRTDYQFFEKESPGELEALQLLLIRLEGTSWEHAIQERIKELTNE